MRITEIIPRILCGHSLTKFKINNKQFSNNYINLGRLNNILLKDESKQLRKQTFLEVNENENMAQ